MQSGTALSEAKPHGLLSFQVGSMQISCLVMGRLHSMPHFFAGLPGRVDKTSPFLNHKLSSSRVLTTSTHICANHDNKQVRNPTWSGFVILYTI